MILTTAYDGRVVTSITECEMSGSEVNESEPEGHEHIAFIVVAR